MVTAPATRIGAIRWLVMTIIQFDVQRSNRAIYHVIIFLQDSRTGTTDMDPPLTVIPVMKRPNGCRQLRIPREAGYDGEVFEVGAV